MKRWRVWLVLLLAISAFVLLSHGRGPSLLQDSDTAALLRITRARQAPLSWFAGDWPLENHFYRPLPTLTFELDDRLWHHSPDGYGWTNAILCVLCIWGLFWLLREMTDSPALSFSA